MQPGEITQDQREVAAFLEDPRTYGGAEVERIDTHAAMVFLAGDRAIKLKRAVWFPFLDFSTVDLRRRNCRREVELNRRTAPDLYLDALPVTRETGGGLALGGTGEPVDWVVEMRRFEQDDLFDRMAERDALDTDLMLDLADAIAAFHREADPVRKAGGADGMRWVVDDNMEELAAMDGVFEPAPVENLADQSRAALDRVADLLDARRESGFVRRCHGDLHLRNIALIEGRPTLFDCIEFNDDIACVDVLYDLAFLLMDLDHRGRRDLANPVFNRYLARTGDTGGLAALPLFLSCRAAVLAKVRAAAAVRQPDDKAAASLRNEAGDYFRRALGYLDPVPPRLVAVGGEVGAGKSTLAHAIAPELGAVPGAVVLRTDVLRKQLFDCDILERLPEKAYSDGATRRTYGRLIEECEAALRAGFSVVADATFVAPRLQRRIERVAANADVPFTGIWLRAPLAVREARIAGRRRDASDATVELARMMNDDAAPEDWIELDAETDVARLAEQALGQAGAGVGGRLR